jgi:hypothetical protein
VKRFLVSAVAICLLQGSVLASADEPIADTYFAPPSADAAFDLSGADVWGRVNPAFCGFPTVSFAADLVVLGRSTPSGGTMLLDGALNPILDASDFGNPSSAGARLNLTFFDQCDWDFMFDALFMADAEEQREVDNSNGVTLFFYQGVAADPVNTARFTTDLDTGEFNVRRRFGPQIALLGGLRYLELSEDLNFNNNSGNGGYTSQADNRLFGGQLGAEGVVPLWGYGRLFATGKYGIYNNRFMVAAQAMSGGAPISISVRDDMAAYVGELNVGWEVETVPCMTLRFGYQAYYLTNMALATDQLNQFSIFDASGSVRKGYAAFHGGFGGLVFTF